MRSLTWTVAIGTVLCGCSGGTTASFKDVAYTIAGERVSLVNGVAEREAAPGSAAKQVTRYFGNEVEEDLDGDGIPDIAFLLTQEAGGSGTFFYLVGAIRTEAGYRGTNGVYIGDRIAPQTVENRDGIIVVDYADRRSGEPMVAVPTVGRSVRLKYDPDSDGFAQIESTRRIGLYQYMADAALFTDCATGMRLPVAMESDHAALERGYLAARQEPGEPMLVSLTGRVEVRSHGERRQDVLLVTRHEQVWPAESCEKSTVETPLESTYWRLVELAGAAVETHADQPRDVHVRFRPTEMKLLGFAGCNDFTGRYQVEADRLVIELPPSTRTPCPRLAEETAFTGALERARRFLILGESLVLSSDSDDVARFEAVYLR